MIAMSGAMAFVDATFAGGAISVLGLFGFPSAYLVSGKVDEVQLGIRGRRFLYGAEEHGVRARRYPDHWPCLGGPVREVGGEALRGSCEEAFGFYWPPVRALSGEVEGDVHVGGGYQCEARLLWQVRGPWLGGPPAEQFSVEEDPRLALRAAPGTLAKKGNSIKMYVRGVFLDDCALLLFVAEGLVVVVVHVDAE